MIIKAITGKVSNPYVQHYLNKLQHHIRDQNIGT